MDVRDKYGRLCNKRAWLKRGATDSALRAVFFHRGVEWDAIVRMDAGEHGVLYWYSGDLCPICGWAQYDCEDADACPICLAIQVADARADAASA